MSLKWFLGSWERYFFLLDWIRPASPAIRFTIKLSFFLEGFSLGKFCNNVNARPVVRAMRRARGAHARPNLSARVTSLRFCESLRSIHIMK